MTGLLPMTRSTARRPVLDAEGDLYGLADALTSVGKLRAILG